MLRTEGRGLDAALHGRFTWILLAAATLCASGVLSAPVQAGPVSGDGPPIAKTSIAGGYIPDPTLWPWTAALIDPTITGIQGDFGKNFCTGMLIAPQRVLTAAHCVVAADNRTPRPASRFPGAGRPARSNHPQSGRTPERDRGDRAPEGVPAEDRRCTRTTRSTTSLSYSWTGRSPRSRRRRDRHSGRLEQRHNGRGHRQFLNYDHTNKQFDQYLRAADFDLWTDAQCAPWLADPNSPSVQHYFGTIHLCANNAPGDTYDCVTHGDSGGPLIMSDQQERIGKLLGVTSFYPQYYHDRCRAGGPFGFAWVASAEMRDSSLTVPHPPVSSTNGGDTDGGGINGGGTNGGGGAAVNTHLPRSWLRGYIEALIRDHTNGKIHRLRRSCSRVTRASSAAGCASASNGTGTKASRQSGCTRRTASRTGRTCSRASAPGSAVTAADT